MTEAAEATVGHNNPPSLEVMLEERHGPLKVELRKTLEAIKALPAEITTDAEEQAAIALQADVASLKRRIDTAHKTEAEEAAKIKTTVDVFFLTRGLKGQLTTPESDLSRRLGAFLAKKAAERRHLEQIEADRLRAEADAKLAEAAKAEEAGEHTQAEVSQNAAIAIDRAADNTQARASAPAATLARTYGEGGTTTSLRQILGCDPDMSKVDLEVLRPYLSADAVKAAIGMMIRARGWKVADLETINKTIKGAGVFVDAKASTR